MLSNSEPAAADAAQLDKNVALRRQLAQMQNELAKLAHDRALPPLEDAEVKIYRLRNAAPVEAADTLLSLFGVQTVRVASDDRTNSLVVFAKAQAVPAVDALLQQLDSSEDEKPGNASAAPHSLMLRLFWLADGLPETEGQDPSMFLPGNVIGAVEKLGLEAPRLVTQTVNSLAIRGNDPVEYGTSVPAILLGSHSKLQVGGKLRPGENDAVALDINLMVQGAASCDLRGSLAMPLGHYMVLGTANSVIGGVYAGEGPFDPASGAMIPNSQYTSRFAFVAQVVEGESFAPEESKASR